MIYGFRNGPSYRAATRDEMFMSAMDQPMSLASTFFDQAKGGILKSLGLGTAIRDFAIPEGEETTGDMVESGLRLLNPLTSSFEGARRVVQSFRRDSPTLTQDAYKASPYFRENIPWDEGMTEDRAAALAMWDDARKVREHYASKRPITAFIGNLAGQAFDPINYVPVAGPAVKAAAAARVGKVAGTALAGSLDAAGNTALFGLATRDRRASYGDDVSWQTMVSEIATAALIGGAFGSIAGALGRRADAKTRAEVEQRLSTLKTTQEARIALNEGIDALVRGEDVSLTPNATEPMARVAREAEQLSRAYDDVRANPTGPVNDPLVRITPEDIEGTIVSRGAFEDKNSIEFSDRGYGLVKIIWGHGEESGSAPEFKIAKEDVLALPSVVRDFLPSKISADGKRREWRGENNGRTIVYADKVMKGDRHLVTAYVQEPTRKGFDQPLSVRRSTSQPVPSGVSTTLEDTAGGLSASLPGVAKRPSRNIGQVGAVDNSTPSPEPLPEGRAQAESRIAKPDDYKALAAQYQVDPETGSFIEDAEIAQLGLEGRLTEDDVAALADAQATFDDGAAFGEALKSVANCLI